MASTDASASEPLLASGPQPAMYGAPSSATPIEAPAAAAAAAAAGAVPNCTLHLDVPPPPPPVEPDASLGTIIVGAGPSGLLVACMLAKAGRPVTVFEARPRPTEFYGSYPVVLNFRGMTAISQLGPEYLERFKTNGRSVEQMHIVNGNKTVAEIDTLGCCIMRDQAVALLLGIADELEIPIYWSHKLTALDLDSRRCTFKRLEGEDDAEEFVTITVDKCIGADGNYSTVRRVCEEQSKISVAKQDWGLKMRYMLAHPPDSIQLPETVDGRVHYVIGGESYVCQQPNGVWSISLSIFEKSEAWLSSDEATPENVAKLRALCERLAGPFAEHLLTDDEIYKSFFSCRKFTGTIVKCSSLAPTDWIALTGDSAHAVAPFTGEGINSALESATVLASVMLRGGSLADYDSERRDDAHAVHDIALRNRTLVSGTPAQKCANTFSTIMIGIGKKMGCIAGAFQDYMLGRKAQEGVWRYRDLYNLDRRQRCCYYPCGLCCFYCCCCCCGRCN